MPVVAVDGRAIGDGRPGQAARGSRARCRCRPLRGYAARRARGITECGSAAWRSRTACSSTARRRGRARSARRRRRSKVAARAQAPVGSRVRNPLLRGPARLAESFAVLPRVKRVLPEAKLPFERPRCSRRCSASAVVAPARARVERLRPAAQELAAGLLSLAPALLALRGGELAAYHGAEHISIGTYEHGEARPASTSAAASHLVGPLLATAAAATSLAARAPRASARAGACCGAPSAPSRRRPRSSAGCSAIPTTRSRARSRGRGTSCSTGSRPPSRRRSSSRSPRRRFARASSWKSVRDAHA